ncbi:DUF1707 SHOCT-like domain-containing protein [Patulibacter minatonensis]|uniref:DUF1707 SHOCT-like domain-containing protein n=1 Tax=Patulibacter minatonensis TaxID=298163 RepID=UPI0006851657|nr:DUF1707 domain-containing protein [Patulibacter minatonensis]
MPGEAAPGRDPRDPVPIRASDAEREHVMDLLRDAASEGRLTFEELADRIAAAGTARTRDELAALTADLPGPTPQDPAPPPDGWSDPIVATTRGAAARAPERCTAILGDLRQAGPWRVPYVGRWSTVFGDIDLDLREAVVAHSRIHLEASSVFGDVTLLVPQGVLVDVRARTGFGKVRQEAGQSAPPGAPVVELTGFTWFGDVRIRAKRLREHLADLFRGRLGA